MKYIFSLNIYQAINSKDLIRLHSTVYDDITRSMIPTIGHNMYYNNVHDYERYMKLNMLKITSLHKRIHAQSAKLLIKVVTLSAKLLMKGFTLKEIGMYQLQKLSSVYPYTLQIIKDVTSSLLKLCRTT